MKGKEYVFVLPGGDYTIITFKENPELDVSIRRGSVLPEADAARLTDGSKRDLERWLASGDVIARSPKKEE